jgi:uncharacterized membrane protein
MGDEELRQLPEYKKWVWKKRVSEVVIVGFIIYLIYATVYMNITQAYILVNNACVACFYNTTSVFQYRQIEDIHNRCAAWLNGTNIYDMCR